MATRKGKSGGKPQADAQKQVKILKDLLVKHVRAHQQALADLETGIKNAEIKQNTPLYGQPCPNFTEAPWAPSKKR
jgi:hypothetical protein